MNILNIATRETIAIDSVKSWVKVSTPARIKETSETKAIPAPAPISIPINTCVKISLLLLPLSLPLIAPTKAPATAPLLTAIPSELLDIIWDNLTPPLINPVAMALVNPMPNNRPTIAPAAKGHALVIPKKHFETLFDVPEKDLREMIVAVKNVASAVVDAAEAEGFNIIQLQLGQKFC